MASRGDALNFVEIKTHREREEIYRFWPERERRERGILQVLASLIRHDHLCSYQVCH